MFVRVQVIDELGEWINHTFKKYPVPNAEGRGNGFLAPKSQTYVGSPLTSETETDDTGITFVPRRHVEMLVAKPPSPSVNEVQILQEEIRVVEGKRVGGHTISEAELIRRRRMIDSHIHIVGTN